MVGLNENGKLVNDYATGNITVTGTVATPRVYNVAGLVGYLKGGSISHSYASGNVTVVGSGDSFGGLVGTSQGAMTNVFASGNVTTKEVLKGAKFQNVGGLIGLMWGNSILTHGYSVGKVSTSTGATNVGGLIGQRDDNTIIVGRSFWDITNSEIATSAGGNNVVGMTTEEMQNKINFTSSTAANANFNPNWDFTDVWTMGTESSYLYPVFNLTNTTTIEPGANLLPTLTLNYPLTISNLNVSDKVYDGTKIATVRGKLSGLLPEDKESITTLEGKFNDKNVGVAKKLSIVTTKLVGKHANKYLIVQPSSITANITPLTVNVTAIGIDKVYDATTVARVRLNEIIGILPDDEVKLTGDTSASFFDKHVGINKPVAVSGITTIGADAKNYTVEPISTTASITPLAIEVKATGVNKVYDATTAATVKLDSNGVINRDNVSFDHAVANFFDKHVGIDKPVMVSDINISGIDAKNYIVKPITDTTASITPLAINVTAIGTEKVYDGNDLADVFLDSVGILPGDEVEFSSKSPARFINKQAGINKPIKVNGINASGADAGNYIFNRSVITKNNITPLRIKVTATGVDKVYNATTLAIVKLDSSGVINGDNVSFNHIDARFYDQHIGVNKPVTVSGISISGTDAENYIVNDMAKTTATITRR